MKRKKRKISPSHNNTTNNGKNGSGSNIKKSESELKADADSRLELEKDNSKAENNRTQFIFGVFQVFASLATVIMAILSWRTLVEMQTERTNAYQPEIVITPNVFEGKIYEELEDTKDIEYLFFDINRPAPRDSIDLPAHIDGKYVLLEKPYLILKNIGKGTAKDVQVEYSEEWESSVCAILADYMLDEEIYSHNFSDLALYPPDNSESLEKTTQSITYIESGEDPIHVKLPDHWYHLLELLYGQKYHLSEKKETGTSLYPIKYYEYLEIPDLIVTIHCLDIQGKPYEQTITIPWDGYYSYTAYPEGVEKDENLTLITRFYGEYLR